MIKQIICFCLLLISVPAFAQDTLPFKTTLLSGSSSDLNAVAMSPAKYKRMAVAGWDNQIFIYQTDSPYRLVQKISGHTAQINAITYNLSGNMMASASGDMTVRFYDSLYRFIPSKEDAVNKHFSSVNTCVFDRSGKYLFSGDRDGKLMLWDALLQKPIKYFNTGNTINDLCMAPQPTNIFVAHADKQIKLIALSNGNVVRTLDGHTDAVNCLAMSLNNQYLISGSNDKTARIWDLKTMKQLHVLKVDSWKVTAVAFTDDSKYCVTACNDGAVKLWEVATGKLIGSSSYPTLNIKDIVFSKDLQYLLIAPKLKEGDDFGARLVYSMIPQPPKPVAAPKMVSPQQRALDSIMAIRPLTKQDSVKYKSLLIPKPVNKSGNNNNTPVQNNSGDSAVIYKTPMGTAPKKK